MRWVSWSLVETSSSQFNLGKSKPVFLFVSPYSSEFCASRGKSLTLPTPAPPQTSHFGLFVCEKNVSSCLSLTTLDNEQGNGLNYLKMKKKSGKTLNKLTGSFWRVPNWEALKRKPLCFPFKQQLKISSPSQGPRSSKMRSWLTTWVDLIQENSLKVSFLVTEQIVPWGGRKHR